MVNVFQKFITKASLLPKLDVMIVYGRMHLKELVALSRKRTGSDLQTCEVNIIRITHITLRSKAPSHIAYGQIFSFVKET